MLFSIAAAKLTGGMDPIGAVGFAASILTFIDVGHKIVTGTLEVLKTGSLTRNTDITIVINDFQAVVKALARVPSGKSAHDTALEDLAKRCQEVAGRLSDLLGTLKTRPGGSSWEAVKLALRSMRKKGEVAGLEERLTKYRQGAPQRKQTKYEGIFALIWLRLAQI